MQGVCNRHGTKRRGSTLRKTRDSGCQEHFKRTSLVAQQYVHLQCKRSRFDPRVGKIPWRRKWQPTPVFRPGEFHGQRSLMGCIVKESDTSEGLSLSLFIQPYRLRHHLSPQRVHQHYLLFCLIIFFPLKKFYTTVKASLEKSLLLLAFLQPMAIILSFSSQFIHYGD